MSLWGGLARSSPLYHTLLPFPIPIVPLVTSGYGDGDVSLVVAYPPPNSAVVRWFATLILAIFIHSLDAFHSRKAHFSNQIESHTPK